MDLRRIAAVARRHWIVVAVGAVLTLTTGATLVRRIQPAFEANGSILILSESQVADDGQASNPLEDPGKVSLSSTVLIERMRSSSVVERLRAEGVTDRYTLALPQGGSGAIMTLHTEASSAAGALHQYDILVKEVRAEMRDIQLRAGVTDAQLIDPQPLSPPENASSLSGSKVRVLAGVAVLGGTMTLVMAALADALYGDNRRPLKRPFRRGAPVGSLKRPDDVPVEPDDPSIDNPLDLILSFFEDSREKVDSGDSSS